jgi:hypothetical protein
MQPSETKQPEKTEQPEKAEPIEIRKLDKIETSSPSNPSGN